MRKTKKRKIAEPKLQLELTISQSTQSFFPLFPFVCRPPALDGTLAGDVGFDPVGFSNGAPPAPFQSIPGDSLKWYREAEIVHGRVAQLAVVGMLFPR